MTKGSVLPNAKIVVTKDQVSCDLSGEAAIQEEYDVEPKRCEQDILELLQKLSNHGLIEIVDEKST